ncbi:hypothetical protein [Psychromicrobium xiongbiense]|uniref:hypothetical protein n=1 Tax=Psychromicrobium xiongbiense TaxID=3051184 RepID=UPI002552F468|nr:hypothetical protein [Psychromicrobium sp. YIM S02556]
MTETGQNAISVSARPFGPYALIRNSLDCSVLAFWLLNPNRREDRLRRRLQIEKDEAHKSKQARDSLGQGPADWFAARTAGIDAIASAAEISNIGRIESTTRMLDELEEHPDLKEMLIKGTWQVCSGLAHGKMWASLAAHGLETVGHDAEARESEVKMTISYTALAVYAGTAVVLAERVAGLLGSRAKNHLSGQ